MSLLGCVKIVGIRGYDEVVSVIPVRFCVYWDLPVCSSLV